MAERHCPNCGAGLTVDAQQAGSEIPCPGCGAVLVVRSSASGSFCASVVQELDDHTADPVAPPSKAMQLSAKGYPALVRAARQRWMPMALLAVVVGGALAIVAGMGGWVLWEDRVVEQAMEHRTEAAAMVEAGDLAGAVGMYEEALEMLEASDGRHARLRAQLEEGLNRARGRLFAMEHLETLREQEQQAQALIEKGDVLGARRFFEQILNKVPEPSMRTREVRRLVGRVRFSLSQLE